MKLEDFLKQNRGQFEQCSTLPKNHQGDMLAKLQRRRRMPFRRWIYAGSAAAVAAAVLISLIVVKPADAPATEPLCPALQELAELHVYYDIKRANSIDSIELLLEMRDVVTKIEIRSQIRELSQPDSDTISPMLLTIDAEKYLALTVQKYEAQQENFQTLINILK